MTAHEYSEAIKRKCRQALPAHAKFNIRIKILNRLIDDISSDTERLLGPYSSEWEQLRDSAVTFRTQYEEAIQFYNKAEHFCQEMMTDLSDAYPSKYLKKIDRHLDDTLAIFHSTEQGLDERIAVIKESIRLYHELERLER